jgi:hypothetical protein
MPKPVTARLTTPAQMVASLPLWLGYTPTESLVVVCCHEPRGRVGLTMRFDLPAAQHEQSLVQDVVRRVRHQHATRVLLAVYSSEPDDGQRPRQSLVSALQDGFADLVVTDAVLVRGDRFFSYLCDEPACCPVEGQPVTTGADDDPVRLLEAEQVLRGQVLLRDREALEASLSGPTFMAAAAALQRCEDAFEELLVAIQEERQTAYRERMLQAWTATVDGFRTPPATLSHEDAAALAVSLADRLLRDLLAAEQDLPPLLRLLEELCRRTPAPYDAPVCTLFAWMTYLDGGGAAVTIALERALTSDPGYTLALLLQDVVLNQVPPRDVRRLTRQSAKDLRRQAG